MSLFSRPKNVDEVAFQDEVVAVLKKSLEGADVSVMITSPQSVCLGRSFSQW